MTLLDPHRVWVDGPTHWSAAEVLCRRRCAPRYHTRRSHVVRFAGATNGWWGDVQPGLGNPLPPRETYTLNDMAERALQRAAHAARHRLRAGQPAAGAAPERARPGDSALVDSSRRRLESDAYAAWLQQLREVCTARGIVLIFDEVFVGFRLAPGGAQQYFGVQADMVTYGKTLAAGCRSAWCAARGADEALPGDRPADICFARGTFNAHPYVMAAMNVFLSRLDTEEVGPYTKQCVMVLHLLTRTYCSGTGS